MGLIAVPNVSEGRNAGMLERMVRAISSAGARHLDTHADATHNRAVLTVAASTQPLQDAMVALAAVCVEIDLGGHAGVHPRLGGLDVCPFVPLDDDLSAAVEAARNAGKRIAEIGSPVYLYGAAALRDETSRLPDLRRGGLGALIERCDAGLVPDFGPRRIDPATGVVCVGARGPLIAFNVWLQADAPTARAIASEIRDAEGGLPGVRALGFEIDHETAQVSMNLTDPSLCGIDDAFDEVRRAADRRGIEIAATEIVGLPQQRFMPDPSRAAARLLREPGRSLESVLGV